MYAESLRVCTQRHLHRLLTEFKLRLLLLLLSLLREPLGFLWLLSLLPCLIQVLIGLPWSTLLKEQTYVLHEATRRHSCKGPNTAKAAKASTTITNKITINILWIVWRLLGVLRLLRLLPWLLQVLIGVIKSKVWPQWALRQSKPTAINTLCGTPTKCLSWYGDARMPGTPRNLLTGMCRWHGQEQTLLMELRQKSDLLGQRLGLLKLLLGILRLLIKSNIRTSKTIRTTTTNYDRAVLRVLRINRAGEHHSSEF